MVDYSSLSSVFFIAFIPPLQLCKIEYRPRNPLPPISAAVLPECRFCYPCPHLGGVASLSSSPTVIAKSYPIRTVIQLSRFTEGFYPLKE